MAQGPASGPFFTAEEETIELVARPADQSQFPQGADSWTVEISSGSGHEKTWTAALQNPLDNTMLEDCRWYLEEYLQKTPYSVTRAGKCLETLHNYGRSLLTQLGLAKVLKANLQSNDIIKTKSVMLSISEEGKLENSSHTLYWEILEDASLWGIDDLEVTVKRKISENGQDQRAALHELGLTKGRTLPPGIVNVLLVVARNLSKDDSKPDEVDPHLALGALLQIQDELVRSGASTRLHVEVVRPGTLQALAEHLERAESSHGPGFFQIVHFDVHGKSTTAGGSAKLRFNSPDPGDFTTRQESARDIGNLLHRYGIEVVVLNACESARANSGDEANLAKTFMASGVKNTLAMSFKVSRSAAEIFLQSFYHALFLDEQTFSAAARLARRSLRSNPIRQARLNLQRSLYDFFIPVVYSAGQDTIFVSSKPIGIPNATLPRTQIAVIPSGESRSLKERLIGRELDLLRLEKMLLGRGKIHFSGRAGVGKTALLRYAAEIWLKTSLLDAVLFIDFAELRTTSFAEFIDIFIRQLPLSGSEKSGLSHQILDIISTPGFDAVKVADILWGMSSLYQLAIVFDGLQALFTAYKGIHLVPAEADETFKSNINMFLETMVRLQNETPPPRRCYMLFVSRWCDKPHKLLTQAVKDGFENSHFSLDDLRLSESLQLAQAVLQTAGLPRDNLVDSDLQELELLLGLLDGNPAAILEVVPKKYKIPYSEQNWAEFRETIHYGVLADVFSERAQPICREMNFTLGSLREEAFAAAAIFSLFWNESPDIPTVLNVLNELGMITNARSDVIAVMLLHDRGFMNRRTTLDKSEAVWIHPLFTICGRAFAQKIFVRETRPDMPPASSVFSVARQFIPSLMVGIGSKKILTASLVLGTIGIVSEDDFSATAKRALRKFKPLFLEAVGSHGEQRCRGLWLNGYDYDGHYSLWSKEPGNLATCLTICAKAPRLPMAEWPLDYFQLHVSGIRIVGSPAQTAEFAKLFEEILRVSIELNGGTAFSPEYQYFMLMVSNCLAALYHCEVKVHEKFKEYIQLSLDIVKNSEAKYGKFTDPRIEYLKGVALRYHGFALMMDGSHKEAEESWRAILDLEKDLFENPNALGIQLSDKEIKEIAADQANTEGNREDVETRLNAISSGSLYDAYYRSRKDSLRLIRTLSSVKEKGEAYLNSRQFRSIMAKTGDNMKNIHKQTHKMGMRGIEQDTRWWPEGFDMIGHMQRLRDPVQRLEALEEAQDSGDGRTAAEHQVALMREAVRSGNVTEAQEHFNNLVISPLLKAASLNDSMHTVHMDSTPDVSPAAGRILMELLKQMTELAVSGGAHPDHIQAFQLLEQLVEGSPSAHLLSPPELEKVQKMAKTFFEGAAQTSLTEKLPQLNLKYMQIVQGMQQSEQAKDWKTVLDKADELEDLLRLPEAQPLATLYDADWFKELRAFSQRQIVIHNLIEKYVAAFVEKDYDGAWRSVYDFGDGVDAAHFATNRDRLTEFLKELELFPLNAILSESNAHLMSGEYQKALEAAEEVLNLLQRSFRYAETAVLEKLRFQATAATQMSRYFQAIKARSWKEALELVDHMEKLKSSNHTPATNALESTTFIDLREYCELGSLWDAWVKAVYSWDLDECARILKDLHALRERQLQTPDIKRLVTPVVGKGNLTYMESWLTTVRFGKSVVTTVSGWWSEFKDTVLT